ncbi:MAG TPA: recombinase family protein [Candidatus Sulfotelmatobacter sp.]|nr:recombinase family protein [Candidatus Sulfotelmatobacter sp.]
MKLAIYSRVSTRDKRQDTENQARDMRIWVTANGHEIVAEYSDQVSGSGKTRRPQFEQMMADAAAKRFEMLVFWSLDRLSREGVYATLTHLKTLDEAGVCWRSHTEAYLDSCGVFRDAVLAILAAVAKQERLRISERVKAGLETARAHGRRGGRPVVGRPDGLVEKVRELRKAGGSVYRIARAVGSSKSTVHRIIKSL